MYQTKGINLPEMKWKEKGQKLDEIIKGLSLDDEKIVSVIPVDNFMPNRYLQIITSKGCIKKCSLDKFVTNYSKLQATKLRDGEEVIKISLIDEQSRFLAVKTKVGLEFTLEVPELEDTQRNVLGTQLFDLSANDKIIDVQDSDTLEYAEFTVGILRQCQNLMDLIIKEQILIQNASCCYLQV